MAKENHSEEKTASGQGNGGQTKMDAAQPSRMKQLMGFGLSDVSSWGRFVSFMNQPRDASSLGVLRIIFAILMLVDIPQERGMARIDSRFGNPVQCHFPLFNFLQPLPVDWMYLVYLVMLVGAVGILLGAFYRLSCVLFIIPYWYVFLLDKTSWNNHSYLYGLLSFMLLFLDANRYWSVDGLRNPKLRNAHVPLWNYALLRTQIFLVYFLAGVKKIDADWLFGYSMDKLAHHWVFNPFKILLTDEQIDLFIVHIGGFLLDLTVGFFLFFDKTRLYAFVFCGNFHIMNSQIFSIGMFPYAMLATMPVFCYADWPHSLLGRLPRFLTGKLLAPPDVQRRSDHCVYPAGTGSEGTSTDVKPKDAKDKTQKSSSSFSSWAVPRLHHYLASCFFLLYIATQLFLPFSHFLTKGYNSWTEGLYGYSWDMMVHNWHTQHVKVHFVDQQTGVEGYLESKYFTPDSGRWVGHGDMIKQFGSCVSKHLKDQGFEDPAIYLDIWKSMNGRFSQRMWDPRVDIVTAPWSPFEDVAWHLPLLTELSNWRVIVEEMEKELEDNEADVAFVADFPGLYLENFVSEDFVNTTLEVLKGEVLVELVDDQRNVTLTEGGKMQVPAGKFHNVHTISPTPSCYMYVFYNDTALKFNAKVTKFLDEHYDSKNMSVESEGYLIPEDAQLNISDPEVSLIVEHLEKAKEKIHKQKMSMLQRSRSFVASKAHIVQRTFKQTARALGHIFFGMDSVITPVPPARQGQGPESQDQQQGVPHPDDEL